MLTPAEVVPLLRATTATLIAETGALSDALLRWHPGADEWCVKDVIGHLIEAERRGFSGRIRIILDQHEPTFEGWDPPAVARARRDCDQNVRVLLDELTAMRADSARLVEKLGDRDLARGGTHPVVGYLRVGDLLHEWVFHDRNHVKQALANVQAYVWPSMGNTQRFTTC